MDDHAPDEHSHHRWNLRSAFHMVGSMRDFWSSDLNRAAVDLINPQPGTTLLDLGAGFGPATVAAAQRVGPGGRVIAVDPSRAMREVLRVRRLWQRSRPLIDVRAGAAEDLPVATNAVDGVLAVNAAHHFDNMRLATAEVTRALRPGGTLLLIDEDFTTSQHPYHEQSHGKGMEPMDAGRIVDLLTATGFLVAYADHQPIAGVTATVISATAPAPHPAPDVDSDAPDTRQSS